MPGLLGSLFSTIDSAKRKLSDVAANPQLSLMQMVGDANDRARGFNELGDAALAENLASGRFGGPSDMALAEKLAEAYNPMGMTVYHGSPHLFSRFDPSKIGTGANAQAYGHGLYLAESPDVARRYQAGISQSQGMDTMYREKPLLDLYTQLENQSLKQKGSAADLANQKLQLVEHMMLDKSPQELLAYAKETGFDPSVVKWMAEDIIPNTRIAGALYKVDLPDEHIAKMLDWDKPLSQQAFVLESLNKNKDFQQYVERIMERPLSELDGKTLQRMAIGYAADKGANGASGAAGLLKDAGIPGIRYLDEGSRGAGKGTSNFVVFPGNEGLLQILERNGMRITP